ncbi:MAG: hypothetical protein ACOYZ8_11635 [Chloroflexota bacterium]
MRWLPNTACSQLGVRTALFWLFVWLGVFPVSAASPRTWLQKLVYQFKDRILIGVGLTILLFSLALSTLGLGQFWVPPGLIALAGG